MKRIRRSTSANVAGDQPPWLALQACHDSVVLPVVRHLQQQTYSCGPASLKIVLDTMGFDHPEAQLAALCGTSPSSGTRPNALAATLSRLGVGHDIVEPGSVQLLEQSLRALSLCIVDYQAWGRRGREFEMLRTGHYSVVFGYDRSHLLLADPAKKPNSERASCGMRRVRKDLFERRWRDRTRDGLQTYRWMLRVPLFQTLV